MRAFFILYVCIAFGCQRTAVHGTHLRLEMVALQQAVLFLVDGNGEVSYGGGKNAVEHKTTWHGVMSVHQQQAFDALISTSNWLTMTKDVTVGEGASQYKIRIRAGMIDNAFVVPLTDSAASSMYDLLMLVADLRFDKTLDALPKPSVDVMLQNRGLGEDK